MLAKTPAYQPKLPRWKHQNQAIAALNDRKAFALFMEMRTGKTKTVLDEFGQDELDGTIHQMLVVAPAGVYRTWEADAKKHLSDELVADVRFALWESGPNAAQQRAMRAFMAYHGPRILLVNVEALSTVKAARELCLEYMQQGLTTMVIDESTTIKNPTASRTRFCIQAAKYAAKRRILSGLPSPQSPLDVYAQFNFLGDHPFGFRSFDEFKRRYAVIQRKPFGPGGRMVDVIVGYQNLDELKEKMRPHMFRVRLADCYDLPEKMFITRDVEMTEAQEVAYSDMLDYAVAELENAERVTATIVLTQMLRLHQILCGVTMSDDGVESDIPENRTDEMMSILENTEGKAIIWAAYDANVRRITTAIEKVYGTGSTARFWGGNPKSREAEERAFKTNPKCRFMVATAAAGGRGRTWDVADTVIYYSNTFSLEHRMQSEERAQAVGKGGSVGYYDLRCYGTIEDKIIDALRTKMNLSDAITGDNWRQWIV
jgi:SNF2 family DNA or RNA helicase